MGHRYGCDKALGDMNTSDTPTQELLQHLEICEDCAQEYKKLEKAKELVSLSAPQTPDFKKSVMERIARDGIEIKQPEKNRRRFVPLGTIAAAAAVFVIYLSVQSSGVNDMLNPENQKIIADDYDTAETIVTETESVYGTELACETEQSASASGASAEALRAVKFSSALTDEAEHVTDKEKYAALYDAAPEGTEYSKNTSVFLSKPMDAKDLDVDESDDTDAGESGNIREKAEALFEKYDSLYPGRISEELFKSAGYQAYVLFVESISDFDAQYTEQQFKEFINR